MDGNTALFALAVFGVIVVALAALGRPIRGRLNGHGMEIDTPIDGHDD
jgi:hypothetical protein